MTVLSSLCEGTSICSLWLMTKRCQVAKLELMYLGVDIGGSKTLLAIFDEQGQLTDQYKLPTNKNYPDFLNELSQAIKEKLGSHNFAGCACAVPGLIDRKNGIGLVFGNLSWRNVPIKKDLEQILGNVPVRIENDANLAALSEAVLVRDTYNKVLYLTVSTGINDGIIVDGKIEANLSDGEAGQMVLEHDGKLQKWEDFASGRALVEKYGKKASEIEDPVIWKEFSEGLALGIRELLAVLQPQVVILGGGVGAHYEKFATHLKEELNKLKSDMVVNPPILKAQRAEEAVAYGCYEFIRQNQ